MKEIFDILWRVRAEESEHAGYRKTYERVSMHANMFQNFVIVLHMQIYSWLSAGGEGGGEQRNPALKCCSPPKIFKKIQERTIEIMVCHVKAMDNCLYSQIFFQQKASTIHVCE